MTVFAHRYDRRQPLGRGASGQVWRAYDSNLNADVALKILDRGTEPATAFDEASYLMALDSDHTVRVFDANVFDDVPYIAMAYAKEGSVEDLVAPFGLSVRQAVLWARQMLRGLQHCHESKLLHRDVKPANVMVFRPDLVRLGDFGVTTLMDADGSARVNGDPAVTAPEGIVAGRVDVRSDVYSAGVTLYRMLTGRWPFDPSDARCDENIVKNRFSSIRDVAPHVPHVLWLRVRKAMAGDPAARYQTAEEFYNALGDPLPHDWREVDHDGHVRCFEGPGTDGGRRVCAYPAARPLEIEVEVRSMSGAGQRIRSHCRTVDRADLPRALKGTFAAIERP